MVGVKPKACKHKTNYNKHKIARTDLLFLILFTGRILFQLGDLGSKQFGSLIRISHFLPLVLLRHGG